MLKTRLVGLVVVKSGIAVQSYGFSRYQPIGKPEIVVEYLDRWGIDEIVLIDIDASRENRAPNAALTRQCSQYCQVPLSVGGGVKNVGHIETLMQAGADKIIVNSALQTNPELINNGAKIFGSQCMIASIDVVRQPDLTFKVRNLPAFSCPHSPAALAKIAEDNGAGEILLNSVNQDGQRTGYELAALADIKKAVAIPVIMCGGVGNAAHFIGGVRSGACAVAAANYFHFTEHSVILTKRKMIQAGIAMRLDTYVTYHSTQLDDQDRLIKTDERTLSKMRFEKNQEDIL